MSSNRDIFLFLSEDDQVEVINDRGVKMSVQRFSDRFEELEVLGEGTVGLVKKCRDTETDKLYAVKMIQTRDEEMVLNMKAEFEHITKLQHENVIRVYELIVDNRNGTVHLIMELFEGKELFTLLAEVGHYDGWFIRERCSQSFQTTALWRNVLAQTRGHSQRLKAEQHSGCSRRRIPETQNHRL